MRTKYFCRRSAVTGFRALPAVLSVPMLAFVVTVSYAAEATTSPNQQTAPPNDEAATPKQQTGSQDDPIPTQGEPTADRPRPVSLDIVLSQVSFRGMLRTARGDFPSFTKAFLRASSDPKYKIDVRAVELSSSLLGFERSRDALDDQEKEALKSIREAAQDLDVRIVNVNVDSLPSLAFFGSYEKAASDTSKAPTERTRNSELKSEIERSYKRWVDRAILLGCRYLIVGVESTGTFVEQTDAATRSAKMLCSYAAEESSRSAAPLDILLESRRGISSDGAWLADVVAAVNMDNCGAAVNLAVFPYDRSIAWDQLCNHAKCVIIETYGFKETRQGTAGQTVVFERDIDYADIIEKNIGTVRTHPHVPPTKEATKPPAGQPKETGESQVGGQSGASADSAGEDKALPLIVRFMGRGSVIDGVLDSLAIVKPMQVSTERKPETLPEPH